MNSMEFNNAHCTSDAPVFLSDAIRRLATDTSSGVGQRDRLDKNNSSMISSSFLPDFSRLATRVVPSGLTRSVTTGEFIIIMACTGLDTFTFAGGNRRWAAW